MRHLLSGLACLALAAMVGCGPNVGTVTGTVTLDGQPGANLVVAFTPEGGGTSGAATTDGAGNYKLSSTLGAGVPPGKYKVTISSQVAEETTEDDAADEGDGSEEAYDINAGSGSANYTDAASGANDAYRRTKLEEKIPSKYNKESTLVEEVTDGENVINFDLTSD